MPVGQESPMRGMGVWARVLVAESKIMQSRYLVMGISPCLRWIISESEVEDVFGLVLKNFENMPSGIVPKPPKPGFVSFGAIDAEAIWVFGYTRRRLQIMQSGQALGSG